MVDFTRTPTAKYPTTCSFTFSEFTAIFQALEAEKPVQIKINTSDGKKIKCILRNTHLYKCAFTPKYAYNGGRKDHIMVMNFSHIMESFQ